MGLGDGVSRESCEVEGVKGIARTGDEVALYAGVGSDKLDYGPPLSQAIRHAQRGDRVTARAAPGDQDPRRRRPRVLFCGSGV